MPQIFGKASVDALPSEVANAANIQLTTDEFGALHTRREERVWAEQGTYFKTTNATFGTGIIQATTAAWSATAAAMTVRSSSATKKIIPHYLRLTLSAAPTTATSSRLVIAMDTANRYSSGGTSLSGQIVNCHTGLSTASVVDSIFFGAVVATAVTAPRYIANLGLKTQAAPCWTLGDEVRILFNDMPDPGLLSGAASMSILRTVGPCILQGANHSLVFHLWNPGVGTAPTWEVEFAWWER